MGHIRCAVINFGVVVPQWQNIVQEEIAILIRRRRNC